MKTFRLAAERKPWFKQKQGLHVGIFVLVMLAGICALPLPAFVQELRTGKEIEALQRTRILLDEARREVAEMKRELPGVLDETIQGIRTALPRVESLLSLRNLLLAQAAACSTEIGSCVLSEPRAAGLHLPHRDGPQSLGSIDMSLQGSAPFENLALFVGLLEATNLVYSVKIMDLTFNEQKSGRVGFHLDLELFFIATPDLLREGPPEDSKVIKDLIDP